MDKKIAGLIGAVAALSALEAGSAVARELDTAQALRTTSYSELLDPVADASNVLKALDQQEAKNVQLAQYYYRDEHHHHHHNRYRRVPQVLREFLPHHHHHHHHGYRYRDWDD